jgi:hypothetical protein
MMEVICRNCHFYDDNDQAPYSLCRRHPPTVDKGWPVTGPKDWCGEFKEYVSLVDNSEPSPQDRASE